ncbi:MAG: DUF4249 domain-containing protein [Bacteroidota bacterium]
MNNLNIKTNSKRCLAVVNKSLLISISLIVFVLFSCEDLVTDIDFPDSDPKIVVNSFISPADTAVMVMLTWSKPINSNESYWVPEIIDNATVKIAETGESYSRLHYYPERKFYSLSTNDFPIEAGKNYSLKVELPDGQIAESECFVPFINESLNLLDTGTVVLNEWEEVFRVEYSFTHTGVNESYYYTNAYRDRKVLNYNNGEWFTETEEFWIIYGENFIQATEDEEKDYLIKAEIYNYDEEFDFEGKIKEEELYLHILLLTTDEHYYKYHKDLEYYYPDDLFSESVHVYSNIKGGLGIFAGYNMHKLKILLETKK